MAPRFLAVTALAGIIGLGAAPPTAVIAAEEGSQVEGSGFSLFDTEAIVGYDEKKVERDPVCDRSKRPRIHTVEPDIVKPGDRVMIKGENFGKKECFRGVSFSKVSKVKVDYKYVNASTIQATVPAETPAGMTFVITITGAGSAQSKGVLVTK
jgi:hypothetical protein